MAQNQPERRELPAGDHVARYCRPRALLPNGRPAREAFMLRANEEYLSTNRLEYFDDSDRQLQIEGIRRALSGKGFRLSHNGLFAVINVGAASDVCHNHLNLDIRFVALGELHDPSHTGIFGLAVSNLAAADLLASLVNLEEVYSAGG